MSFLPLFRGQCITAVARGTSLFTIVRERKIVGKYVPKLVNDSHEVFLDDPHPLAEWQTHTHWQWFSRESSADGQEHSRRKSRRLFHRCVGLAEWSAAGSTARGIFSSVSGPMRVPSPEAAPLESLTSTSASSSSPEGNAHAGIARSKRIDTIENLFHAARNGRAESIPPEMYGARKTLSSPWIDGSLALTFS